MAKEIPYFKFYTGEWFTGDIVLEDFETQGLFINVCAFYWSKDCYLSAAMLLKKFKGYDKQIESLIEAKLVKTDGKNIFISFLDEQMSSKEVQKVVNRVNGSKGGRPKKITEEKPNGLNLGFENETETKPKDNQYKGKERKEEYIIELSDLNKSLLNDILSFFGYVDSIFHSQQSLAFAFVSTLDFHGRRPFFTDQFDYYKRLKTIDKYKHSMENFLGKQSEQFKDGKWNDNWMQKYKDFSSQKSVLPKGVIDHSQNKDLLK